MERSGAAHGEPQKSDSWHERLKQGKKARSAEEEWVGDIASQNEESREQTSQSGQYEVVRTQRPSIESSPEIQKIKAKIEAEERAAKRKEPMKAATSPEAQAKQKSQERKHDILMRSDGLRENAVRHFVSQIKEKSATQPFAAELRSQLELRTGDKGIDSATKIDLVDVLMGQAEDEQKYAIVAKVLDQLGKMQ